MCLFWFWFFRATRDRYCVKHKFHVRVQKKSRLLLLPIIAGILRPRPAFDEKFVRACVWGPGVPGETPEIPWDKNRASKSRTLRPREPVLNVAVSDA